MIKKIIFAASVLLLAFSCDYDTIEERKIDSNMIIKTGTICGWCAANDTLTITSNSVRYVNYIGCSTSNPSVMKSGTLTTTQFDDLIAQLNFEELKKLDLNSENIAFDGCDDWIYYQNGSKSHYIRFTRNDPKLQPIHAFVDQLNTIKTQYMGEN